MAGTSEPWWICIRLPAGGRQTTLAAELGVQRITAEVLIRRGYDRAETARAFLEQDGPAHDPMLLGDMAAACDADRARDLRRRADLRPRRLRRRRHLRDRACRDRAARARRQRRVASPEPVRRGLRPGRRDGRAAGGRGRSPARHGRLRHHGRRRGGPRRASWGWTSSSPITTGRPTCCPTCTRVCTRPVRVPVPRAVRNRRGVQARPGAARASRARCGRARAATSTWSPSRRSPTSFPSATRTAASCARACAGCGARRSRACAR